MPGLTSYWESAYHHADRDTPHSDSRITFYHTFARMGAQHLARSAPGRDGCSLNPGRILEATVYKQSDIFQVTTAIMIGN